MSKKVSIFDMGMTIENLSKAKAKELKSLALKKNRDREGIFIAEGEKCVFDIYEAFELVNLICTPAWLSRHDDLPSDVLKKVLFSDVKTISIFSTLSTPPEVIAVLKKRTELEKIPKLQSDTFYVLLDDIQDPGNFGTIIRTCDWFGIYQIFASKNTVDLYNPKVIQATMGSLSRVNVVYAKLKDLILNNKHVSVIGGVLDGKSIYETNFPKGGFLILGNEGKGISEDLKNLIDIPITIPAFNKNTHPDSLNVAISNAIILSYIRKTKDD